MAMTSGQFPDVLDPAVDAFFSKDFEVVSQDSYYSKVANVIDLKRSYRKVSAMGRLPKLERFTGTIAYAVPEQLYDTTITPEEYALGCQIERKLYDDALFGDIKERVKDFANSVNETIEQEFFDAIFNNGYTSKPMYMSGGDGQNLFSASHPTSPNNSTTMSNYTTNTLSHANVWTGITAMMAWTTAEGFLIRDMIPDVLLVGRNLIEKAHQIIHTEQVPGSGNWNANILNMSKDGDSRFGLKVMYCPYITGYKWYLISSKYAKKFLEFLWRVKPETFQTHESDTLIGKWATYCRLAFGYRDWRWVYGSFATS